MPNSMTRNQTNDDNALWLDKVAALHSRIVGQLQGVVVGQKPVVEHLLIGILARGHVLLVGVPGLAKTLLVKSLSQALGLQFGRIQFTPDLMPTDITGTDVLEETASGKREFRFLKGPVFCNLLLADELNRTPPKTQAALLQAMQEQHVTIGGNSFSLPDPFLVLATQNPIEQSGTYPLPEAQLDRFMMQINVEYPDVEEEMMIVRNTTVGEMKHIDTVVSADDLSALQRIVPTVPCGDHVIKAAVQLVRSTRPGPDAPAVANESISFGAGPRAAQMLVLAAKARALLQGRFAVDMVDIQMLAPSVLRHRLVLGFEAEAQGVSPGRIVDDLVAQMA